MQDADERHYRRIAQMLARGRMIPFLGAGANLCDRAHLGWEQGGPFLPSGAELARHLAECGLYPPYPDDPLPEQLDLLRVSEYVAAAAGEDELYAILREVFVAKYSPTSLHRLLARAARALEEAGLPQLLVVTTNYDDLVELALEEEGLEFDVIWYEAKQNNEAHGRFVHRAPGGRATVVKRANEYTGEQKEQEADVVETKALLERPAVLKLHGCVDRESEDDDSYVITEDSYIDYLSLSSVDVGSLIPIALWNRLMTTSLLFLGYSLSDWNLRVILNRIQGVQKLQTKSWAVQREPEDPSQSKIEQTLWNTRENVELVYCELSEYVKELEARLDPELHRAADEAAAAAPAAAVAGAPAKQG